MKTSIIFAVVAVGFVMPSGAIAQELSGTLAKIKNSGIVTIGHRESSVPFSYYDDNQNVVGYSMDLCDKVVGAIKEELELPGLQIKLVPVSGATRIPLLANGTIDLECGSTTNNAERGKQVAFGPTHFVAANRFVSKTASELHTLDDLKGKSVVAAAGTTNIRQVEKINSERDLDMGVFASKDLAEGFLMVQTDRASAFFLDDVLLAGLVANSKSPTDYTISSIGLSVEPYGIMYRRDDPRFATVVNKSLSDVFTSGEGAAIYQRWFTEPVPPRGINLNFPMSEELKRAFSHPTNSPDPAEYQH
ncbi:amino acid ABC transporter substrate-binding protein [Roseibium algicola]|uniref:Amino acid ABC transporter substrate-binding protein n=1 Tax=Roseibium algicola TaxID=2857014 RepID=A0ABM6I4N7_9HYPH|nr:transporter substrate-binding domain-containing protein [Roseibium aggregatum]AQQ05352.1 amino acid ABC transporter substrate-binding protein [Roseibium aggregatum]